MLETNFEEADGRGTRQSTALDFTVCNMHVLQNSSLKSGEGYLKI